MNILSAFIEVLILACILYTAGQAGEAVKKLSELCLITDRVRAELRQMREAASIHNRAAPDADQD